MVPRPKPIDVDGAVVGVYEYGDPKGAPVLTFHGVPASGAGFAFADEPARARGLRVLAPDRPGVGVSSPARGWSIGTYPARVAGLADALGLEQFGVWGYSGGGPYAVSTAASLGERVTRTAVCAGMGEIGAWAAIDDFEKTDRQMLSLAPKHPFVARLVMGTTGRLARLSPGSAYKSFMKELAEADRVVAPELGDAREAMALFTEAFTRGARGVVDDYRAIAQPWHVDFAAIRTPMRIFQGSADTMVPERHARELVARIPGAELVVWPGAGHLGTIAHVDEVLDWFVG